MSETPKAEFDLAVLGSGGGAFAAAIRATDLGRRVVMIERGTVGGTCVNTGWVPSKALPAAADARHVARDASGRFPGISTSADPVDMSALTAGKQDLVTGIRSNKYLDLIAGHGWDLRRGSAAFTGSVRNPELEITGADGAVETVRARSRLLSGEELEVSKALQGVLADEGVRVVRRAAVDSVRPDGTTGGVVVTATTRAGREEHTASRLLVATGRRPVTEGLRLESVGVRTGERGEVLVDDALATANARIWAAGDVTGHPDFVYVASAHGALAVENAFENAGRRIDHTHLPRVAFTSPAVGAVGLTDRQATAAGIRCECRVLPLEHVPRALVNRDTRGFVKIVAEVGTGRFLGITAVADNAGELAAAGVYVVAAGMTVDQVASMWSPCLTMSEGIRIAAQSFGTDVSRLSCCAA